MIDSFPDLYRISTDDGETADYTLNGMVSLDTGDEFVFQPDTTGVEIIGDSRLPLGKVTMVTTRQGDVFLLPSNRLADARPVTEAELVGLAFDYLACAPFVTPAEFIHTPAQVAAMLTLLGGEPADLVIEAPESPVEVLQLPEPSGSPNEPDGDTGDGDTRSDADAGKVVESPKAEAPAVDPSSSASPEPNPDPSLSSQLLASLDLSQPVSPDPAEPSLLVDSPAATSSGNGPVETATATETLIVNVEDEPPQ